MELGSTRSTVGLPPPTSAVSRFRNWIRRHRPEILLVALAIVLPEVLTGSTPVLSLLNPIDVVGLLGFYGAGSLLIRDVALRWKKGWAGVLLLGLAYGIAEEGIATKTMVDSHSSAAGFLSVYGHFFGVNWVFAVVIALFHAIFSIALPILIVGLTYPSTRGQRFLSDRGEHWTLAVLLASVGLGYLAFDPRYFEGYGVLLGFILAIVLLVVVVRSLPEDWLRPPNWEPLRSPRWFAGLGMGFSFGWAIAYLILPRIIMFPAIVIAIEVGLAVGVLVLGVRMAGRRNSERHEVYFAAGLLAWYFPWDAIIAFALGDPLVLLFLAAVFYGLYRLVRRYPASPPSGETATALPS